MDEILYFIDKELDSLAKNGKSKLTAEVRRVSRRVYRELFPYSFEDKLNLCGLLLEKQEWAKWIIAYDIAFRERKSYTAETFDVFEDWLKKYVNNWDDCDDFCVHALGALVLDYPELFEKVLIWCKDPNFVVRRAAAVSMIYSIRKSKFNSQKVFMIADHLLKDEHDLVLKGYGWMLKEYSIVESKAVEEYLRENVRNMPRVAYRYALEKLNHGVKRELMSL